MPIDTFITPSNHPYTKQLNAWLANLDDQVVPLPPPSVIIDQRALRAHISTMDARVGCITGMASGDAQGASYEFMPAQATVKLPPDPLAMGSGAKNNFNIRPGQYTDDTSQGLCLAEALMAMSKEQGAAFPAAAFMTFVSRWWSKEGFHNGNNGAHSYGLGATTAPTITQWKQLDPSKRSDSAAYNQATGGDRCDGNGSLMRLAPVPAYAKTAEQAMDMAFKQSKVITKGTGSADASRLLAWLCYQAIHRQHDAMEPSAFKQHLLSKDSMQAFIAQAEAQRIDCPTDIKEPELWKTDALDPRIKDLANSHPTTEKGAWHWRRPNHEAFQFHPDRPPTYYGSYAPDGLAVALYCVWTTDNFQDAVSKAALMQGDADSNAAMAGMLAGAIYGQSSIPQAWLDDLGRFDIDPGAGNIHAFIDRFLTQIHPEFTQQLRLASLLGHAAQLTPMPSPPSTDEGGGASKAASPALPELPPNTSMTLVADMINQQPQQKANPVHPGAVTTFTRRCATPGQTVANLLGQKSDQSMLPCNLQDGLITTTEGKEVETAQVVFTSAKPGKIDTMAAYERTVASKHSSYQLVTQLTPTLHQTEAIQIDGLASQRADTPPHQLILMNAGCYRTPDEIDQYRSIDTKQQSLDRVSLIRQLDPEKLEQELITAYTGFDHQATTIATGNWGCGPVLGGDPELKFILQWLAASMHDKTLQYHGRADARFDEGKLKAFIAETQHKTPTDIWWALQYTARKIAAMGEGDLAASVCDVMSNTLRVELANAPSYQLACLAFKDIPHTPWEQHERLFEATHKPESHFFGPPTYPHQERLMAIVAAKKTAHDLLSSCKTDPGPGSLLKGLADIQKKLKQKAPSTLKGLEAALTSKDISDAEAPDTGGSAAAPKSTSEPSAAGRLSTSRQTAFFTELLPFILEQAIKPCCDMPILLAGVEGEVSFTPQDSLTWLARMFLGMVPTLKGHQLPHHRGDMLDLLQSQKPACIAKLQCILAYFKNCKQEKKAHPATFLNGAVVVKRLYQPKALQRAHGNQRASKLVFMDDKPPAPKAFMTHQAEGYLVADFANKYMGGGALGAGAVQEEIHLAEHPECLLAMACCPRMHHAEVVQISGAQQHAKTKGYGSQLAFDGATKPENRAAPTITAMDAIDYVHGKRCSIQQALLLQLHPDAINREIHKAMVAFTHPTLEKVATGNWGCGAFGGQPELKLVIQLIAASLAGKTEMRYHAFGDKRLPAKLVESFQNCDLPFFDFSAHSL